MEIILKQAVENLGNPGDRVNVSNGYARNFLFPKGFAIQASKANIAQLEHEQRLIAQRKQREVKDAEKIGNKIRSLSCILKRQSGEEDKLFGSVTSIDIAAFLTENGIEIDRRKIQLEEPIKSLGTHRVPIEVHPDVVVELKVKVQKENA